jgi:UDP-N-acetylmuramoyl-tripeptide--D-alanyl-D-alanine ligase
METLIEQLYALYLAHPEVTTDSRHCPAGSLFFALKGANFDGNKYAAASLAAGCAAAVVDDPAVIPAENADAYFLVPDVLAALQQLAAHHRRQFRTWARPVPVIGITGTNGKTTTKELLHAVLSRRYRTCATAGNLNNQIGVPLTLLRVTPDDELAIIEMGANHPLDIAELCAIVHPDFGLITTVAKGHLLGFGSFEGVIAAKTKLYDSLRADGGTAFVNLGNPHLVEHATGLPVIGYSAETEAEGAIVSGRTLSASPLLRLQLRVGEDQPVEVQTHLVGTYNLLNMVAAATVGHHFGVPTADIAAALADYTPANMRSQLLPIHPGLTLILDAYNANPDSMMAALTSFAQNTEPHKQLILGDMGELGAESQAEHLRLLRYLIDSPFGDILLVGSEMRTAFESLSHDELLRMGEKRSVRCYATSADLCADTQTLKYLVGTVLVKGSRSNALEKVVEVLKGE